jgi:anaerobic selenocysteine-containing dehydrogenase
MIKSVCGYCGVGCGLEYDESKLVGDIAYPTNEGLVCAKGVSELHTIQTPTRLLRPKVKDFTNNNYIESEWDEIIEIVSSKIKSTDPSKIAFYLSGQLLTEDYYVANKLAKGFIGTNHVDTNSRTCMASAVVAYKKVFGVDYVPVRMEDIYSANLLILIGANPAESHVVLANKIKKAKKSGLKVIVIDPRYTDSAKMADLYLPIKVGTDIDFLSLVANRIVEDGKVDEDFVANHTNGYEIYIKSIKKIAKKKLLKRCGISSEDFEKFMELFYENENIISAWTMGLNQSVQGVDKNFALINLHLLTGKICKKGNGPFSLTGQPNAMGGREVGGLSTMLAVHLDFDAESIEKVAEFWGCDSDKIVPKAGLTATEIIDEALDGNIEMLIISHTDPLYHLPNQKKVRRALENIPFIVEINAYKNSLTSEYAHIRLPAAPWGEKEGTQTNMDRTITKQEKLTRISIDCKPDWEIFSLIGQKLGFAKEFGYSSAKDIFNEYKEMTRLSKDGHLNIYEADWDSLSNSSFVWGEGLFDDKKFLTDNQKANIFFVENKRLSEKTSLRYPYILLTGRTRDQWHSGTKTALVDNLKKHKSLDYIEINSIDAKELGINDGDNIKIVGARGEIVSVAKVTENINQKTIFAPISKREINILTNDLVDPISKEPDYNHTAVKIEKI